MQNTIFNTYGRVSPSAPVLRCRNATQTSVVLEWDPLQLATADLKSLSLYRNGSKAGNIPRPTEIQATKISGLAVDTEYVFHLVLRTSAGTYSSEKLAVKTHKMTDLSGITITPGVLPNQLRESLEKAAHRIGAKLIEGVRIDTTHFVCTEGKGQAWEKALEMNIPVVRPEWVDGCEREGRIVGVRGYYLNADPRLRQVGPGVAIQTQQPASQSATSSRDENQKALPIRQEHSPQPPEHTNGVREGQKPLPSTPPAQGDTSPEESDEDSDQDSESTEKAEPKIAEGQEGKARIDDMKSPDKPLHMRSTETDTGAVKESTHDTKPSPAGEDFSDVAL